jgi:hypothetical protein
VTADEPPYAVVARSPSGVDYDVQATQGFGGGSGPVQLGRGGIAEHGPLGWVNRLLRRYPISHEIHDHVALVFVREPEFAVVGESRHRSAAEAREAARAFVRAIEDGSFREDRTL